MSPDTTTPIAGNVAGASKRTPEAGFWVTSCRVMTTHFELPSWS